MAGTDVALWKGHIPKKLPRDLWKPADVIPLATQLTNRDKQQIISAVASGNHEMAATFIWNKALSSLKAQLGKLGSSFIGEMLDRPDIDENSPIEYKLTDYEALRLAQELGVIGGTGAFRLRQSFERLHFFGSLSPEEAEEEGLTEPEAVEVIRSCVENILGLERIEAAVDFKRFRESLTAQVFDSDSGTVQKLVNSPYFFYRASVRMLLAVIKSATGAQLENALGNSNVLIPELWSRLLQPERYQIGRAYAEVMNEGKSTAASGLKRVLLRVRGFDFVPEDLRSNSFIKAANAVIAAHEGMNNFYNEPGPTRLLERMGSAIPMPAFATCMSAVLAVRLGNRFGRSWEAQPSASGILERVSRDRWIYYFKECLPSDDRILYKLLEEKSLANWKQLILDRDLEAIAPEIPKKEQRSLIQDALLGNTVRLQGSVQKLIHALGYASVAG